MPYRSSTCFVPDCRSGYAVTRKSNKKKGTRNPSLFKAPKDIELLRKWRKVIPRTDRRLQMNDVVCELHFHPNDVMKYFETKLPNGETHRIIRDKYQLKKDAVPKLFLDSPPQSNTQSEVNSPPIKEENDHDPLSTSAVVVSTKEITDSAALPIAHISVPSNSVEKPTSPPRKRILVCANIENRHVPSECSIKYKPKQTTIITKYTPSKNSLFHRTCEKLDQVKLPSQSWFYTLHKEQIIFMEWSNSFVINKKVIINSKMSVMVLFGEIQIQDNSIKPVIETIENIDAILKIVDELIVCPGINAATRSDSCSGIGFERKPEEKTHLSNVCSSCKEFLDKREANDVELLKKNFEVLKNNVVGVRKQNVRLQQKVIKLTRLVEFMKRRRASAKRGY